MPHDKIDRRSFLGAALAPTIVPTILPAAPASVPAGYKSPAGNDIPFRRTELFTTGAVRTFAGAQLNQIA
ncbi:MAG: hypothetical protein HY238_02285, partial [Acidobacteria bacterium]|nr:hypothetical protein [Acidobacteriota bacterium]